MEGDVEGAEGDGVDGYMMVGLGGNIEGVTIRSSSFLSGRVPAGGWVGDPTCWPAAIPGEAKTHRCEAAARETENGTPTTGGHRCVGVPSTFTLECAIGSCREIKERQRTVTSMRAH